MIIDSKQKLRNTLFYNNLLLILSIFALICIITSICLELGSKSVKKYSSMPDNQIFGPIVVTKKPLIYEIKSNFLGYNDSAYISGEVLNEDKDTLYEFGHDSWHESGYEGGEYWSESDNKMVVKLTFDEPGTYYIKLATENNKLHNFNISFSQKKASGIPHLMLGSNVLIFIIIAFILLNLRWVKENLVILNDKLEEWSDD